jgi:hypothetical protein
MYMDIDELLTKYFEGETTSAEERQLRGYFAAGQIPGHLEIYKPLFAYFDEEARKVQPAVRPPAKAAFFAKPWIGGLAVAASVALLLLVARYAMPGGSPADPCLCSPNYVVINGRCYTDIQKVRSLAFEALREVASPDDVLFPGLGSLNNEQ